MSKFQRKLNSNPVVEKWAEKDSSVSWLTHNYGQHYKKNDELDLNLKCAVLEYEYVECERCVQQRVTWHPVRRCRVSALRSGRPKTHPAVPVGWSPRRSDRSDNPAPVPPNTYREKLSRLSCFWIPSKCHVAFGHLWRQTRPICGVQRIARHCSARPFHHPSEKRQAMHQDFDIPP